MISFVFTCLIMGIFLLFNYTSSSTVISSHLFWFATLFYFIFLLPVFSILRGENMRTMSRGLVFVIITNNFIYLLSGALFLQNMGLSFKASGLLSLFIALVNFRLNIEPQQQYHFRCPKQGYIVSVQLNRNCNGDKCQHKPQRGMHEEFIFLPILPQPKNQS